MEVTETLYVTERKKWRAWLKSNYALRKEIWLIYYKKHTGKPRISYDDAVEEAICYGWIDSTVKKMDEERYCQRYTPRNLKSVWSHTNIGRLRKMLDAGMMEQPGLDKVPGEIMAAAMADPTARKTSVTKMPTVPEDLEAELDNDASAKRNWERFAPSHKKMYIYWINDAKKKETRQRRIDKTVQNARENRKTPM